MLYLHNHLQVLNGCNYDPRYILKVGLRRGQIQIQTVISNSNDNFNLQRAESHWVVRKAYEM